MSAQPTYDGLHALAQIGAQVTQAATVRAARHRRRRRLGTALCVGVSLLGLGGTAAAVGDFSTGLPVIDRILTSPASRTGDTPSLPGPHANLQMAGPDGSSWSMTAYLSRDGAACAVAAPQGQGEGQPLAGAACASAAPLFISLDRVGVRAIVGQSTGAYVPVFGTARGDASGVVIGDNRGRRWRASLTEVWGQVVRPKGLERDLKDPTLAPALPSKIPLRAFLAIVDGSAGALEVRTTLDDGRVLVGHP